MFLAPRLLLEPIPGDSKFGPKLCCCVTEYRTKPPVNQTMRQSSLPLEMYTNNRDLAERGYLPHPGWNSFWQLYGKLMLLSWWAEPFQKAVRVGMNPMLQVPTLKLLSCSFFISIGLLLAWGARFLSRPELSFYSLFGITVEFHIKCSAMWVTWEVMFCGSSSVPADWKDSISKIVKTEGCSEERKQENMGFYSLWLSFGQR